ncbi:MAG: hypothetical protein WC621_05800, partial [Patescibacteria group bacterium]
MSSIKSKIKIKTMLFHLMNIFAIRQLISLSSAARNLPYSADYLRLRARQGKLKAVRKDGAWYTTAAWAQDYVNKYSSKTTPVQTTNTSNFFCHAKSVMSRTWFFVRFFTHGLFVKAIPYIRGLSGAWAKLLTKVSRIRQRIQWRAVGIAGVSLLLVASIAQTAGGKEVVKQTAGAIYKTADLVIDSYSSALSPLAKDVARGTRLWINVGHTVAGETYDYLMPRSTIATAALNDLADDLGTTLTTATHGYNKKVVQAETMFASYVFKVTAPAVEQARIFFNALAGEFASGARPASSSLTQTYSLFHTGANVVSGLVNSSQRSLGNFLTSATLPMSQALSPLNQSISITLGRVNKTAYGAWQDVSLTFSGSVEDTLVYNPPAYQRLVLNRPVSRAPKGGKVLGVTQDNSGLKKGSKLSLLVKDLVKPKTDTPAKLQKTTKPTTTPKPVINPATIAAIVNPNPVYISLTSDTANIKDSLIIGAAPYTLTYSSATGLLDTPNLQVRNNAIVAGNLIVRGQFNLEGQLALTNIAKLQVTGPADFGNLTAGSITARSLNVSSLQLSGTLIAQSLGVSGSVGARDLSGQYLSVGKDATFGTGNTNKLTVNSQATFQGPVTIASPLTLNSTTTLTGTVTPSPTATSTATTVHTTDTGSGASLVVANTTGIDAGNLIQVGPAAGNIWTRVTAVAAGAPGTLTIVPSISRSATQTVAEYTTPSLGSSANIQNRFDQGYFLNGIVVGSGTTYITDGLISTAEGDLTLSAATGAKVNIAST